MLSARETAAFFLFPSHFCTHASVWRWSNVCCRPQLMFDVFHLKCRCHFNHCSYWNSGTLSSLCDWSFCDKTLSPLSKLFRSFPLAILTQNQNQLGLLSIFINAIDHDCRIIMQGISVPLLIVSNLIYFSFFFIFLNVLSYSMKMLILCIVDIERRKKHLKFILSAVLQ